ncbi:hypothetical protein PSCICM_03430 [Pseudomonas cichorii]|nr:hypothetical protein PSCICM_03430 [Pseudomonas cichorii]
MKARIAAALLIVATSSSAEDLKEFKFSAPPPVVQNDTPATCAFKDFKAPDAMVVYAAGAYSGRELPFQIDQSGHQATQFDIAVNSPEQPVALILGAYEPTVWNIGWSQGTKIVAVYVSGYHRQGVAGLDAKVPVLNSSYENKGPCGYLYVGKEQNTALNPLSRQLFGQPVKLVYPADKSGNILIGQPLSTDARLVTSTTVTPESFQEKGAPLAGQPGLEEAVANGLLRAATNEDALAWVNAKVASTPERDVPPVAGVGKPRPSAPALFNAYVVLKPFTYPAGLYGAHAATFFIPKGVPVPKGQSGHSAVYDFNSMRCIGAVCQ